MIKMDNYGLIRVMIGKNRNCRCGKQVLKVFKCLNSHIRVPYRTINFIYFVFLLCFKHIYKLILVSRDLKKMSDAFDVIQHWTPYAFYLAIWLC